MLNNKFNIILFSVFCVLLSCKKNDLVTDNSTNTKKKNIPPKGFFIEDRKVPGIAIKDNNTFARNSNLLDPHNGDQPIILGNQLPNPYSLANMQQAINILYGINIPVTATHLYVRFKPSTVEQLITLDETENLELQDYPMDYELVQDGDYYQDPNLGTEDFHWLYTVVEVGYNFPQGIQMEIIEQLFLPENNEILEDLAESITLGASYTSSVTESTIPTEHDLVTLTRLDVQVDDFEFQPDPCYCDPTTLCTINPMCEEGGAGGGGAGSGSNDGIYVEEQTTCNNPSTILPLRQVNVVAKRWFKVWRGYTNNLGKFTIGKQFQNKVKIIIKTQNNFARVSKVRGLRLWQMLMPNRIKVGVFNRNELPNIRYVFNKPAFGAASSKELANWAAATTHNSIIEFREYTTEFNLTQPPENLHVMVTNWGKMEEQGAAPMWHKCHNNNIVTSFVDYYIANSINVSTGIFGFVNTLKNQVDIVIGYKSSEYNCNLTSPKFRSIVYHELGHAQHFAQASCDFWTAYRNAITNELISSSLQDPYGDGNNGTTSDIIATGEMWGNHVEKWYSERHYGNGGASVSPVFLATIQGVPFGNPNTILTLQGLTIGSIPNLNANFAAIESFDPNLIADDHRWIPQGLPYDLFDIRNDGNFPLVDEVDGYTINQSFNALQPDVRSIPTFRNRLLQQNANFQQVQVNQLFQRYGY